MSSVSGDEVIDDAGLEDDLFGDESGDEAEQPTKARELSDEELDSGDDEGRSDREPEREEIDYVSGRDARVLDQTIWRHPLPKPADGEFNSLRLPKFLGIDPLPFNPATFQLPLSDHHTSTQSSTFSASATALSTIRYRKNATTGELESNTVIHKWADGSATISVGDQQYEMQTKPLAPPRDNKTYVEVQDSHQYIASPSILAQMLVVVGHLGNQYTVRPNKNIEDDALERLQKSLAAATRGTNKGDDNRNGPQVISRTEDPELQKKRAEIAEKERNKELRRRDAAAEKANLPSGSRRAGGGLLSVDDLEGRGRRAPPGRKPKTNRPHKRRGYSSDEEEERTGRGREDEYDEDDGFLVGSDEEIEEGGDDSEDEEELESEDERPAKKQKKSQREVGSDEDAPADLDDIDPPAADEHTTSGRGRKRNVVEDDEDE